MSKASNLAGFSTSISPPANLNVGVVTATSFVGNLTGNVTGTITGTASTASFATTSFGLTGSPNITVTQLTATRISAGSTTGTTGQVLQSTGTGIGWTTASAGGVTELANVIGYNSAGIRSDTWNPAANGRLEVFGQGNFQVFTSPGTFVVNPGISSIRVRVVGAGGNGGTGGNGYRNPTPGRTGSGGQGGGAGGGGGYAHKVISSFTAPRTYSVTVGSAPGGTSSFGSEVSATGGSNGTAGSSGLDWTPQSWPSPNPAGGSGGSGSGGDVNFTGATGTPGSDAPLNPAPVAINSGHPGNAAIGGVGAASATQKGNASGSSVPGLTGTPAKIETIPPSVSFVIPGVLGNAINRFPFDIFNGFSAIIPPSISVPSISQSNYPLSSWSDGSNGGAGYSAPPLGPLSTPSSLLRGGNGGLGGGGGTGSVLDVPTGNAGAAPSGDGGVGGIGGGGAGGAGGRGVAGGGYPPTTSFAGPGGAGGPGGSGIVIVEW